jgi:hypothetical protein
MGNQMFQYAAATSLGERLHLPVFFDIRHYDKPHDGETPRICELDLWNLRLNVADDVLLKHFDRKINASWMNRLGMKLGIISSLNQPGEHLENLPDASRWFYLRGYYQNESHFISSRARLLAEFIPKNNSQNLLESGDALQIAVHVRRGDYVSLPSANAHHGVLPLSYYLQAIEVMRKRHPQAEFLIFSDDIEWCQRELKTVGNMVWVDENYGDNAQQIYLMSQCHHHIISNSSFSWWGAWLNTREKAEVIAPMKWTTSQNEGKNNIVPSNWEQW